MRPIVHSVEAIEVLLRRGLSPITGSRGALLALGFERAYPQVRKGHESTIWERSVEHYRRPDRRRALARERAYLIDANARA
jgi:hypothetical protein